METDPAKFTSGGRRAETTQTSASSVESLIARKRRLQPLPLMMRVSEGSSRSPPASPRKRRLQPLPLVMHHADKGCKEL